MVDKPISKQELIDAQKDSASLEKFINGGETETVQTRLDEQYPTLANAVYQVMAAGGFEPFATETELKASVPAVSKKAAKAMDTKKIWYWNGSAWVDTGLSELDQAKNYANANAAFNPVKPTTGTNLDTLKSVGIYFVTTVADATLANNYPVAGLGGILHVVAAQNSSLIFQEFRAANGVDYWRSWNGSVWTIWKLKTDLSTYEQSSKSFTDLGAIASGTDLNNLQTSGRWSLSDGSTWATTVLNFPIDGFSGTVEVIKNTGSSLILQRAVRWISSSSVETYTRMYRNAWSAWVTAKVDTSNFETITKSFTDLGSLVADVDLNNLKTVGRYSLSDGSTIATTALNYPKAGISGTLEVIKNTSSSIVTQKFTVWNSTAPEFWIRVFRNSWSAWIKIGTDLVSTNTFKISSVFSASMLADDLRTEAAVYLVNNNTIDLVAAGLPEKSLGLLEVSKGTVSSFAVQKFISATSGKVYVRFWNNIVWSAWITQQITSSSSSDLIVFTKTASVLSWYLPNSGTGTNKLRHTYNRGITPENNRDSWGMGMASVYSEANALVQNLTTTGVWECAIIDSQNAADHSGGGHGDEVKFLSYFLVDGVKYDEDFTGTFTAKEVKHIQHSIIYVEAQNIPICTRKTTWTFNKNLNTSKTKLEWATGRTITKARIAMLPIYRKSNGDGTGNQITDTEIRSQDDQIINVTEHGFALRDLPIKDADSILLSSAVSNISAEVKIKKIVAQNPCAYVQNTILYNKIYVNGFAETAAPFVTGANDVWEIETEFVIKVRS